MANLQLNANEEIIDRWRVVYLKPYGLFNWNCISCDGYIYVTNQRILFDSLSSGLFTLELSLSELTEFWTSKIYFVPNVTVCNKDGETFKFSGFKTKKLVDWLQQLGIPRWTKEKGRKRKEKGRKRKEKDRTREEQDRSRKKKTSMLSRIMDVVGVLFILLMFMGGVPTGWLYDLGVGTGTEQGQKPGPGVHTIESIEEAYEFFWEEDPVPATVDSTVFVRCPLMRLRDTGAEKGTSHEYQELNYPITPGQSALTFLLSGAAYNSYYLVQLEDGSYLCVFFDDYLMLQKVLGGEIDLPVGYVRSCTSFEHSVLYDMAKECDYDVDVTVVLDMYRDGKCPSLLDKVLRLIFAIAIVASIKLVLDKRKKKNADLEWDHTRSSDI